MLLIGKLKCEIETLNLLVNYMVLGMVVLTHGPGPCWRAQLIGGRLCSLLCGPWERLSLFCQPQEAFWWSPNCRALSLLGTGITPWPEAFSSGASIFVCVRHFELDSKTVSSRQPTVSDIFPSSSLLLPSVIKSCFGCTPLTENAFLGYLLPALQDRNGSQRYLAQHLLLGNP